MSSRVLLLAAIVVMPMLGQSAKGQSLWQHRSRRAAFPINDTQAIQVGDIVTVLINETTGVENRDQRQLDREADNAGGFGLKYAFGGQLGNKEGSADFDMSTNGQGSFDGQSQYSVDREFSDRITATVTDCLPSGNLVIYGRRERMVTGERRALTVQGVIRPLDILADNTIESQYIANFRVCYDGDGIETRFNNQGWLTKAWNKYRPL